MSNVRRPGALAAFLLAFAAPGVGHLYKGEGKRAFAILGVLLTGFAVYLFSAGSAAGVTATLVAITIFQLWCLFDAARPIQAAVPVRWYNRWYTYVASIAAIWIAADLLSGYAKSQWYEAYRIPGASLSPTLVPGDHVMVDKRFYRSRPIHRGDIVAFKQSDDPMTEGNEAKGVFLKRVIAVGGEVVEVRDMRVLIDGAALEEPYARWAEGGIPEGEFAPKKVPPGSLFLLGDNRDHSKDSRFWQVPFLPAGNVLGKARYIYWSWDDLNRIGTSLD